MAEDESGEPPTGSELTSSVVLSWLPLYWAIRGLFVLLGIKVFFAVWEPIEAVLETADSLALGVYAAFSSIPQSAAGAWDVIDPAFGQPVVILVANIAATVGSVIVDFFTPRDAESALLVLAISVVIASIIAAFILTAWTLVAMHGVTVTFESTVGTGTISTEAFWFGPEAYFVIAIAIVAIGGFLAGGGYEDQHSYAEGAIGGVFVAAGYLGAIALTAILGSVLVGFVGIENVTYGEGLVDSLIAAGVIATPVAIGASVLGLAFRNRF